MNKTDYDKIFSMLTLDKEALDYAECLDPSFDVYFVPKGGINLHKMENCLNEFISDIYHPYLGEGDYEEKVFCCFNKDVNKDFLKAYQKELGSTNNNTYEMTSREEQFVYFMYEYMFNHLNPKTIKITFADEAAMNELFCEETYFRSQNKNPSTQKRLSLFFYDDVTWTYRRHNDVFTLTFSDKEQLDILKCDWGHFMGVTALSYCSDKKTLFGTDIMINNFLKWCDENNIKYTLKKQV